MTAIRCEHLRKEYRDTVAVEGLDLTVEEGKLYALLGVNGAGKTTTIRMLCGLTEPSGGDAYLGGKSIRRHAADVRSIIAISPQQTAVAPGLSVYENLDLICGVHGLPRAIRKKKIDAMMDEMQLGDVRDRRAGKLSGGWQRRLSIAMALISEPQILFLDEPTLGLDVLARSDLWELIRSLKGKITIVLTTHYLEEAEALSDHIGIMKAGRLLVSDTPERICQAAGTERFEEAFIRIVKEKSK